MNPEPQQTAAVPVWNVETLREHVLSLFRALDARLTERHDSEDKAVHVAFTAQTTAMQAAFTAQKEAVAIAFVSQKEAVNAALAAADRAVIKAETAAEKRFESVNEFRETLADQQRMLMPRIETESLFRVFDEKLQSGLKTLAERADRNEKALNGAENQRIGQKAGWQWAVAIIGLILSVLGIASFAVSIILMFKK